jgi:hypothetical protein
VITVKECKFRAMVDLDPSARADAVRRLLNRTRPQCVLQPCDANWFPAAVSVGGSPSQGRPVDAVVRVCLLAGELEAFFATGQPFTVWADAIVDDQTVRGEGRLGDGFIVSQESAADEAPRAAVCPALAYRRTVVRPRRGTGASVVAGRQ